MWFKYFEVQFLEAKELFPLILGLLHQLRFCSIRDLLFAIFAYIILPSIKAYPRYLEMPPKTFLNFSFFPPKVINFLQKYSNIHLYCQNHYWYSSIVASLSYVREQSKSCSKYEGIQKDEAILNLEYLIMKILKHL